MNEDEKDVRKGSKWQPSWFRASVGLTLTSLKCAKSQQSNRMCWCHLGAIVSTLTKGAANLEGHARFERGGDASLFNSCTSAQLAPPSVNGVRGRTAHHRASRVTRKPSPYIRSGLSRVVPTPSWWVCAGSLNPNAAHPTDGGLGWA